MPSISDWQPYTHDINKTTLDFNIHDDYFEVDSVLEVERKDASVDQPLFLNGKKIELLKVSVNDSEIGNNEYTIDEEGLTIHSVPDKATIQISQRVEIDPNAVDGLYRSEETLVTQCEDEAFRKIAFFPDRPDVLSQFEVRIEADKATYPVLLSNGNEVENIDLDAGRHAITYVDEFPKPCYLFALVAGKLVSIHSTYQTRDSRSVALAIYSDSKSIKHCVFAMNALKRAMRWDERTYDRVYDLDRFSIVAVNKFLFGAMENKSLNIFNTQAIHADPDVATDENYERIEGIVAHEYFHNYSGNRVTVRDWFQLSLKEGFTVFRDQSYTRDQIDPELGRIIDANHLRNEQYPEAQSGLAHPVQPAEMTVPANYYTRTIYEGGAELIYMLSNMVGLDSWFSAANHYFDKFDNQAVTIDDFIDAIAEHTGKDLNQFKLWYSTSGTPQVKIEERRDKNDLVLSLSQYIPPTADQPEKPTLAIPLAIGALDKSKAIVEDGNTNFGRQLLDGYEDIETSLEYHDPQSNGTLIFILNEESAEIRFKGLTETRDPVVSVLRDFSAPVELTYINAETGEQDFNRLSRLCSEDTDVFVRWDSLQQIYAGAVVDWDGKGELLLDSLDPIVKALTTRPSNAADRRLIALDLIPPPAGRVLDLYKRTPVETILEGREKVLSSVFTRFGPDLREVVDKYIVTDAYDPDSEQASMRCVRHAIYRILSAGTSDSENAASAEELATLVRNANNLTDRRAFFQMLLRLEDLRDLQNEVSEEIYERFQDEPLVVDKWITDNVSVPRPGVEETLSTLLEKGLLDDPTPNRWRAAYSTYASNWHNFHRSDGSGYTYYTDRLLQDADTMGGVISRGIQPLAYFHRHDQGRAEKMKDCLARLLNELPSSHVPALDMAERALRAIPESN